MVLAAIVSLWAAEAARAAPLKMMWDAGPDRRATEIPIMRSLGVRVLEVSLQWRAAAPTRPAHPTDPADPAYRWPADLDALVRDAQAAGMRVAILLKDSPGWATGGRDERWAPTT